MHWELLSLVLAAHFWLVLWEYAHVLMFRESPQGTPCAHCGETETYKIIWQDARSMCYKDYALLCIEVFLLACWCGVCFSCFSSDKIKQLKEEFILACGFISRLVSPIPVDLFHAEYHGGLAKLLTLWSPRIGEKESKGKILLSWLAPNDLYIKWCILEPFERNVLIEKLPKSGWHWGVILIVNWCKRAQLTVGNTIPWQMVLDCIRKLINHEPVSERTSGISSWSLFQVSACGLA